jgi:hypothetical protein
MLPCPYTRVLTRFPIHLTCVVLVYISDVLSAMKEEVDLVGTSLTYDRLFRLQLLNNYITLDTAICLRYIV